MTWGIRWQCIALKVGLYTSARETNFGKIPDEFPKKESQGKPCFRYFLYKERTMVFFKKKVCSADGAEKSLLLPHMLEKYAHKLNTIYCLVL